VGVPRTRAWALRRRKFSRKAAARRTSRLADFEGLESLSADLVTAAIIR